jgi:hypothetical protein
MLHEGVPSTITKVYSSSSSEQYVNACTVLANQKSRSSRGVINELRAESDAESASMWPTSEMCLTDMVRTNIEEAEKEQSAGCNTSIVGFDRNSFLKRSSLLTTHGLHSLQIRNIRISKISVLF